MPLFAKKSNVDRIKAIIKSIDTANHDSSKNVKHFCKIKTILTDDISPYYNDGFIRDFLNKTYKINDLIPKLEHEKLILQKKWSFEEEISKTIPVFTYYINLIQYRAFLKHNHDLYQERFGGANPLHGQSYFFQKTIEHFISYQYIKTASPREVIDIGSAGHTFPLVVSRLNPKIAVFAQDLCFPPGCKKIHENFFQIGGSAACIPLPDSSIDYICFHCSLEHFEGNADTETIKEVERLLRPGGVVIIVPLYKHSEYTLIINPVSGPFIDADFMAKAIVPERENGAVVGYATDMISRFTRLYSCNTFKDRILDKLTCSEVTLHGIEFESEFLKEEILPEHFFSGSYRKFAPHNKRYFLKIRKTEQDKISK